ncbi:MAG: DNA polymerase I [Candidatus Eisenbacteria bacterium]|uniref:DNA polymerase I n=1 Tax=Eiseniibacteriota bacterium TaxID=2212470 RepID=A0A948W5C3_UNCEI|nr:DNA polymerase I [Candidatus Eisenbacteria bacterium]MBU2689845.1 DNA polymerase I [Candidatus Eisenbacteria bacterium]
MTLPKNPAAAVYIVDGTALVYRAHYAFISNPLRTGKGRDVSALFGFINTIFHLIREVKADSMMVMFDTKGPTFRHEMFKEYKATRPEVPPEIIDQIPDVKRFLDIAGIPRLEEAGMEADDLISSFSEKCARVGKETVIVSADKDLMQLVGPKTFQYIPAKGREPARWMGPQDVEEKWGVPPQQLRDFQALAGDHADNVPGVSGIGPKTAVQLLKQFHGLDEIYGHLEAIPSSAVRKKLEAGRESAYLSRELVTLRRDLHLGIDFKELKIAPLEEQPELRSFLREFEFRRLENSLGGALSVETPSPRSPSFSSATPVIATVEALKLWAERVAASSSPLGLAAPGTDEIPFTANLTGLAFSQLGGEQAAFVKVGIGSGGIPGDKAGKILSPLFSDRNRLKVGHDFKRLIHLLQKIKIELSPPYFDTQVASYVLDPSRRHDIGSLSKEFLNRVLQTPDAGKTGDLFSTALSEDSISATMEEAEAVLLLYPILERECRSREQEQLLQKLELPLVSILARMESVGIALDVPVLERMRSDLQVELNRLEGQATKAAGIEFNLNSPSQLREILFDQLKLPTGKKTKTGYSTDSGVLEGLAGLHPLPGILLEYRQLSKLQSTYVEVLPRLVDPVTHRLHALFHQTVTATGRLSSSHPNLQNIPIRSELGRKIRKAFVASPKGWVFLSADYSQIELRLLAHLSSDDYLLEAFHSGDDIHKATACRVFGVTPDQVDGSLRARAKIANFGIIYGMGPQRLAVEMGIPIADAKRFIEEYLEKLPGVRNYLTSIVEEARQRGFVETIAGRRRYLPDLQLDKGRLRSQAERMAINTPIQGSAADLIKQAMVGVQRELAARHLKSRLVLQIHDELLLEIAPDEKDRVGDLIRREMEGAALLTVPLVIEEGWGETWWDAHA